MAGRQKNTRVQLAGDLYYWNQRKCNIRKTYKQKKQGATSAELIVENCSYAKQ